MPVNIIKSEDDDWGPAAHHHHHHHPTGSNAQGDVTTTPSTGPPPTPSAPEAAQQQQMSDADDNDHDDHDDNVNDDDNDIDIDIDIDIDSDNDPIVREVDVYLSPALADQIYLLQYPLQHHLNPAAQQLLLNRLPTAARIKPIHAQLELEYPIITTTTNTTATTTTTTTGSGSVASAFRQGAFPYMTRRVFQSQTIPVETHMCLGQLKVDEDQQHAGDSSSTNTKSSLHLVPLQHISQMRPSFRHIEQEDAGGDNFANNADNNNKDDTQVDHDHDDHDHNSTATEQAEEKKPIVFQRKESERAAMIRKSSYAYKKASHDAEEWQDLIVCDYSHSPEFTSNLNQIGVAAAVVSNNNNHHQEKVVLAPLLLHKQHGSDKDDDDDANIPNYSTLVGMNNYIQSLNYVKVSTTAPEDSAMMMSASSSSLSATSGTAVATAYSSSSSSAAAAAGNHASASSDIKSIIARMTVLLGNGGGGPIPYSILRDQFVTSIASSTTTVTAAAAATTSGGTSTTATGVVVVSNDTTDAKLFHALSICAVLVRGNFCLHSKFLSLTKSMQRARTFLLLLFHKYQTVQKSRLCQLDWQLLLLDEDNNTHTRSTNSNSSSAQQQQQQQQQQVVTLDKLHVLLQQVGKRTNAMVNAVDSNHHATAATAGWVLRVEDNLTFVAAHPEEAAQHLTYWNRLSTSSPRIKQLLEQYNNAT